MCRLQTTAELIADRINRRAAGFHKNVSTLATALTCTRSFCFRSQELAPSRLVQARGGTQGWGKRRTEDVDFVVGSDAHACLITGGDAVRGSV